MWKVSAEESLFPDLVCHFFLFLYLCHSPTTCNSWVLLSKLEVVHCVLSFWLLCVMLRSYMLILFQDQYLWISFQIEPDVTLCYHCMQPLELVQTKNSISSHSVRFPSGLLKLSSKKYKGKYFGAWKNTKKVKCWNLQNWWLKSLSLGSFMKKVTKSLFFISSLLRV